MKTGRQDIIVKVITENEVETQEELVALLRAEGVTAAQATISRDVRDLGLRKTRSGSGKKIYALPANGGTGRGEGTGDFGHSYKGILSNSIKSIEKAGQLIVLKTVSGVAMAVGAAVDQLGLPDVAGCIAGDDTIFIAVKEMAAVDRVIERLKAETENNL